VKITRASTSGGMIIQNYDYAVRSGGQPVYTGDTYFGFFSKQALANQVGLREEALYVPSANEKLTAYSGPYPREFPFPEPMLRMVDRITWFSPEGGTHGLGAIEGQIDVDPDAWFFKAHFYQDPVWPGSLGLESFLQLLRFVTWKRWGSAAIGFMAARRGANESELRKHQWIYRGQVLPTDREVTVQAIVTHVDDQAHTLSADGLLSVDGRIIYKMSGFTVEGS
jgi:3-hydroxymyristoyl/3-hydroxydecanoyl-(acyl carrier protein) dehydratase